MLGIWFKKGYKALRDEAAPLNPSYKAFVDKLGRPFTKSSFSTYWKDNVRATSGTFFEGTPTATLLRSSFVDEYTCGAGSQPEELWEAAARLMGTSVRHWKVSYATKLQASAEAKVVKGHRSFTRKAFKGQP